MPFGLSPNSFLIVIGAYFGCAVLLGLLGRRRKLGGWGYFFATLLLTPLIGLLLYLASDPRPKPKRARARGSE